MERSNEISELCMCAVRYALGRRTYVSASVPRAVLSCSDQLTDNAIFVMKRDVGEWIDGNYNDGIDWPSWLQFLNDLNALQSKRSVDRYARK